MATSIEELTEENTQFFAQYSANRTLNGEECSKHQTDKRSIWKIWTQTV